MELYLVRHGETTWNQEKRYQGQHDIPLTPKGHAQARALGAWLRERLGADAFDGVWTSDLQRARDTAALLAAPFGLRAQPDPRLREMDYGEWEGLTLAEVEQRFAEQLAAYHGQGVDVRVPGGETLQELANRVVACVADIYQAAPRRALVVAHGGTIRTFICALLGISLALRGAFALDNTGLSIIQLDRSPLDPARKPRIVRLNQTSHLESLAH